MQVEHCEFAEDLHYDFEYNVWVKLEAGVAKLGITSVHAALAGRVKQVKFKPVGAVLRKGQSIATIESIKYFGAVRTPLSGRLLECNSALESDPKLANDRPYTDGWFAALQPSQLVDELNFLSVLAGSEERIRAQIRELRVRCFKAYPDHEMWEIGVECAAVLVRLSKLVERISLNEIIHVVSDDPTADIEMERWSDQTGQAVLDFRKEERLLHFIIKKVK